MSDASSTISYGPPPRNPKGKRRRPEPQTPQQKIDQFWSKYKTKAPGKGRVLAFAILVAPLSLYPMCLQLPYKPRHISHTHCIDRT